MPTDQKGEYMSSPTALIVEAEAIVALDLQNTLQRLGYEDSCYTCRAEDAFQKFQKECPKFVVMDVSLQGDTDGIEIGRQIRKMSSIPIVYLTSYMDENTLEWVKPTAPFCYVIKPFEENELHSAIKRALNHR
jgi:CheY-like chemotaxis protein